MSEFTKPSTQAEFEANFRQIKPLMSETEAYYESSRCLFCYDAPCVNACPTGIDIPLFIRQINSKNDLGAAKTIYDANYFGFACGKVCPTEVLCEGACVYNHSGVKPIEIGRLQSYAAAKALDKDKKFYSAGAPSGKKVAVIGAGPAGISCACELSRHGIEVDIFEAKSMPTGLTLHGVAPYKITNTETLAEMAWLERQFGFRVFYNHRISTAQDIELLEKNYDAIFIGIGLGETAGLHIPGENLENVLGAVEFIEQLRLHQHRVSLPGKVIVLGGGNTAMDAASESARLGANPVLLAYRRSREEMGAYGFEYDLAKNVGVKALFNAMPVEIIGMDRATAVRFVRTRNDNGKVEAIPGSEFTETCDWVIKATGQAKGNPLFRLIDGLKTNSNGTIRVDEHFQTSNPKYYAAGDGVSGGQEVVNAVADGKKAALNIINPSKPL